LRDALFLQERKKERERERERERENKKDFCGEHGDLAAS
jgi:hypothetical protein